MTRGEQETEWEAGVVWGGGGKGGATLLSMWVNTVFTLEDPTSNGSDPLIC